MDISCDGYWRCGWLFYTFIIRGYQLVFQGDDEYTFSDRVDFDDVPTACQS